MLSFVVYENIHSFEKRYANNLNNYNNSDYVFQRLKNVCVLTIKIKTVVFVKVKYGIVNVKTAISERHAFGNKREKNEIRKE